jgi:hypothetical protein
MLTFFTNAKPFRGHSGGILLMQDFSEALGRVKEAHSKFLMVGRRRWQR